MFGDMLFLSPRGQVPGWQRYFTAPHWSRTACAPGDVRELLAQAARRAHDGAWIVLALAYEAAPAFDTGLAVHAPDGAPLAFAAAYAAPATPPPPPPARRAFSIVPWRSLVSRRRYDAALAAIRENIRQGEVYQVNYTIPLASRCSGDPRDWFAALAREQDAGYSCLLDLGERMLLSFSPELFFARQGEAVTVRPMKGTMARGRTVDEDAVLAAALAACPKNRAENRMITDLMRNDLGRIASRGSVAVPDCFTVSRLATAWQMTSTVTARVPLDTGLEPLVTALFPCGSITGAPKRSAMELIRRLEPWPRGFYTGAIGHIAPGGDCLFNVAIRTVEIDRASGRARFGVGGGVTHYSTAGEEYAECAIKTAFLQSPGVPFALLETLRLCRGRFAFLAEHQTRLARSAAYFGFRHDPDAVANALAALRRSFPHQPRRVRLLLWRDGTVRSESFPLVPAARRPLRVGWANALVDAALPDLFHKTTRRDRYEKALRDRPGYDDVLFRNTLGQVTESTRANLVAAIDGRLLTPALDCGLLPGTYRQRLLHRGVLAEAHLTPADLAQATRLWLINSVRLWQPAILVCSAPDGADAPSLDAPYAIC